MKLTRRIDAGAEAAHSRSGIGAQESTATHRAMSGVESGTDRWGARPAGRESSGGDVLSRGQRGCRRHRERGKRKRGGRRGGHGGLMRKQGAVAASRETIGVKMRCRCRLRGRRRRAQNAGGIGRCGPCGDPQLTRHRHDHDEPHGKQGKPYGDASTGGGGQRHARIVTHERQNVRQRRQRQARTGEAFRRSGV